MSIQIKGYDIHINDADNAELNNYIQGIAHLEYQNQAADVGFEGRHEKGMTGFVEFNLVVPDHITIPEIEAKKDEIRDILAEHLLEKGYEAGEYRDTISVS